MDKWFSKKRCDRCGRSLDGGRTMSRFDTACLCMRCAEAERHHPDYQKAVEAELAEIRKGNYNFKGIGYTISGDADRARPCRTAAEVVALGVRWLAPGEVTELGRSEIHIL